MSAEALSGYIVMLEQFVSGSSTDESRERYSLKLQLIRKKLSSRVSSGDIPFQEERTMKIKETTQRIYDRELPDDKPPQKD